MGVVDNRRSLDEGAFADKGLVAGLLLEGHLDLLKLQKSFAHIERVPWLKFRVLSVASAKVRRLVSALLLLLTCCWLSIGEVGFRHEMGVVLVAVQLALGLIIRIIFSLVVPLHLPGLVAVVSIVAHQAEVS